MADLKVGESQGEHVVIIEISPKKFEWVRINEDGEHEAKSKGSFKSLKEAEEDVAKDPENKDFDVYKGPNPEHWETQGKKTRKGRILPRSIPTGRA